MGHSSVPADQEPFATILGLEDGTPCFVDEGALHHPIPTPLPLLAEIPMVGMQRCECCSCRGGIHGRMAVRCSVACQDPILQVPTLGKTVPSDETSHRSDPRGTHTRVSKALPAPVEHQGRHRQVTHRPTLRIHTTGTTSYRCRWP